MSKHNFLGTSLLYLIYILFFYTIYIAAVQIVPYPEITAAAITLLLVITLQERFKLIIKKFSAKRYYSILTEARQILETANSSLNSAVRYHEVTKYLVEAFTKIFGGLPYAFYLLNKDKYHLVHYDNIYDRDLLSLDIKSSYFSSLPANALVVENFKDSALPGSIIEKLSAADLISLLPFRGHTQIFAFLLINHKRISFFDDKEAKRNFVKIQKKAGKILENMALLMDLEKKNFETHKLIEVSQKILSSFDIKNILDFILSSLKSLINYDTAVIFLLDKSGKRLLNTSSEGYDSSLNNRLHLKVGQGACGWVVKTKQIDVVDDVRTAEHYFEIRPETRSQISIPLIFDETVLGVICLESSRQAFFSRNISEILQLFAHQAAIAIHNSRQLDIMLAKKAYEHDLVNAGTVQQRLLVHQFPHIQDLSITAVNIPSKIISGDLYDIIKFNDYTVGIAIGDVSGKGAPAALMMTLILAGLRSQKKTFLTVCDIVCRLNNLLYESIIEGKYATFFYSIFAQDQNKLIYTNAGHNPPIIFKTTGEIIRLTKGGIVLGFLADQEYIQDKVEFNKGDLFLAYTDGVTETMNRSEEEFGEKRLIELVKSNIHLSGFDLKEKIIEELKIFSDFEKPDDDITLIICKHE